MQLRLLLLIDDSGLRARLQSILRDVDAFVRVPNGQEVTFDATSEVLADVLIIGRDLIPDPVEERVARLSQLPNRPAVVVLCGGDDAESLAILRAAGAEAALYTEVSNAVLRDAVTGIVDAHRELLSRTVAARRSTPRPELSDFVSASPSMQRFMQTVRRVVDSHAPLLITGETGVGKERLARAIHNDSRRADGPFISINCGAIPENLLESQLFGHEKGAFTGATRTQRGCFELAHGGTLFLDEIGELPLHLEVKLLQVLQDYEVAPVGSERKIPVDVRVITATNRDIKEMVEEKRFRGDLYYRLSVVSIEVPPLRERKGDIATLTMSILEGLSVRIGRGLPGIAPNAIEALCAYAWPGNVRELINVLERAVLLYDDTEISLADLPEEIAASVGQGRFSASADHGFRTPDEWLSLPLKEVREKAVEALERAYLERLLSATGGRIGETAKRAGIEPRSLFNKMRHYGFRKEDYRE